MDNDHSTLALVLSWFGLLASWVTLSHLLAVATLIFTILQIVIALRKMRREERMERLQAELQRPEKRL